MAEETVRMLDQDREHECSGYEGRADSCAESDEFEFKPRDTGSTARMAVTGLLQGFTGLT